MKLVEEQILVFGPNSQNSMTLGIQYLVHLGFPPRD